MTALRERFRGCLLGGAVGDALGAGIEFMSMPEIRSQYGPAGVTGYVRAYGRTGAITDDTQMALFTAEGLLRARHLPGGDATSEIMRAIWHAYQRWLLTQTSSPRRGGWAPEDGWLVAQAFLHDSRSPGMTCLEALTLGSPGSVEHRINDSKGCGGLMRVAPVGLVAEDPFTLGCEAAALTHGHPNGYLAAGCFALMISKLVNGSALSDAVDAAITRLRTADESAEVIAALTAAVAAAGTGPADVDVLERLGEGWVAEEALAIATYCALAATDFRSGVLMAVNHGGDSDSTGAICGNLLGTRFGAQAIDTGLLAELEGRDVIEQVADDLYSACNGGHPSQQRYPPG